MMIYEMRATFGKLDDEILRLEPGMNWIVAPNEWGKSTWCAFLTAMLYGIDTRERSGKDTLADKEHYAPWSGKPMEGLIRLEHQGRDITIARRTKGRVPLGEFVAFETQSGLPIRELTAENCGQVLLGVERSVFQRSGFIRLKDMPVGKDEALRRRLNALVTTGDESAAADRLAERLKDLKNKCRYNRTGLIPQCREQLNELNAQLRSREALDVRLADTTRQEQECRKEIEQLECHQKWLEYGKVQANAQRLSQAVEADAAARRQLEERQALCRTHLSREELEARLVVQANGGRERKPGWVFLLLGAMALVAAGILAYFTYGTYAAAAAALAAVLVVTGIILQSRYSRWEKEQERQFRQREQWIQEWKDWDELDRCRQEAEQARNHLKTLRGMIRTVPKPEGEDPLDLDGEQTADRLAQARDRLHALHQLRGETLGRMADLPQAQSIQRQIQQTELRLKELEQTYLALGYAQKALEEAMESLQRRFAPQIIRRAQALLSRMTYGKYTGLQLSMDLELTASASNEAVGRNALWRSDGTADQMYLALRVAVWEALTPGAPLVLDDALVRFDNKRLEAAMEVLKELARDHQVIVFTCR